MYFICKQVFNFVILFSFFTVSDTNYTLNQTFAELNPAWSINAGLTYTSQLVKLLSFFLDVFLTRRPNFKYIIIFMSQLKLLYNSNTSLFIVNFVTMS